MSVPSPVVFVHGAGAAARNFGTVVRRLQEAGVEARAVDLPGHGRNPGEGLRSIEDMARFVLEASPEAELIIGGHSMGGGVALTTAALAPERVKGVVLIATGARFRWAERWGGEARKDFEGFLAALQSGGTPKMTIDQLTDTGGEVVARDLEAAGAWSALEWAPKVTCPVLLIAGERDAVAIPKIVRELADALGEKATLVVIDGAGHVVPVEKPGETAGAIVEWMQRL